MNMSAAAAMEYYSCMGDDKEIGGNASENDVG